MGVYENLLSGKDNVRRIKDVTNGNIHRMNLRLQRLTTM